MIFEIICGKKGCGKTTYIKKLYPDEIYLHAEQFMESSNIDYYIFADAFTVILDEAERFGKSLFNAIVNGCKLYDVNKILLVMDLASDELLNNQNILSLSDIGGISRELTVQEFIASEEDIKAYIQYNYPEVNKDDYDEIISLTGKNYSEIDALMFRIKLSNSENSVLNGVAIKSYLKHAVSETFKDISEDIYSIIEKSSVIGNIFSSIPLESEDGFGIESAEEYIKKATSLRFLIHACENSEHQYEFPMQKIYETIFDTIDIKEKHNAAQVLVSYYSKQYSNNISDVEKIKILNRLLQAQKLSNSTNKTIQKIRLELLYLYSITKDWEKIYFIADEILHSQEITPPHGTISAYLQEISIRALRELGKSSQAVNILKEQCLGHENLFLYRYRLAQYLYDAGDIDNSLSIVQELINSIKPVSNLDIAMNRMLCNAYSLMATLQNHLSLEDKGAHYYRLALNRGKMSEDTLYEYYSCIKKCGMFVQHNEEIGYLKEAATYFEDINCIIDAGEVYFNLATEMMFNGGYDDAEVERLLKKSLDYFGYNSLKLSYVFNNLGIFYALVKDDIIKALEYFHKAKLLGLSDFTYMTINLNICMCDLILNIEPQVFSQDYNNFIRAYEHIASRKNATAYEDQYKDLLDAIVLERQGENSTQLCYKHISQNDDFFIFIWKDILGRQESGLVNKNSYPDNYFFYEQINRKKIFLAEFRYWE